MEFGMSQSCWLDELARRMQNDFSQSTMVLCLSICPGYHGVKLLQPCNCTSYEYRLVLHDCLQTLQRLNDIYTDLGCKIGKER